MRYAIIKDDVVVNVIELERKNLCGRPAGHDQGCALWHCPSGCTVTEAGEGPNKPAPFGRAAGPGDTVQRFGVAKTVEFVASPKAEPAPTPETPAGPLDEARAKDLALVQAALPAGAAAALERLLKGR